MVLTVRFYVHSWSVLINEYVDHAEVEDQRWRNECFDWNLHKSAEVELSMDLFQGLSYFSIDVLA